MSEQNRGRRRPRTWLLWLAITAALLALNYWAGSRATHPPARVHLPYRPFVVTEVAARNSFSRSLRAGSRLDALADALLEHETLGEDEAYAAAGLPEPGELWAAA